MNLVLAFSVVYALNMYFQSYGAVSIIKVKAYWFHVRERGVFGAIKRELRRRSAIEPVIGHLKSDGHLGRNYLKGRHGDHANAVLSAVGHNLRLILNWLRLLLRLILTAILDALAPRSAFKPAS